MKRRLHNLDYLRGLSAFGIMIFHFYSWMNGKLLAETFLGRLGIYGVSIFYILSGLTLYYVYFDKMTPSLGEISLFFKKRIFRIFPLLWLTTLFSILLSSSSPNLYDLFLNLTGLFGFIKWDTYFSPGVWSIGNELVFYTFFPLFIYLSKSFKWGIIVLSASSLILFFYFTFFLLSPELTLSEQWSTYINPLNQIFFFFGGFLMGYVFKNTAINTKQSLFIVLISLIIFILFPSEGDSINLVTGVNRLIFTASCFLICFSFFKSEIRVPNFIHHPLTLIGESSYSIYLLHPIIFKLTAIALGISSKYFFDFGDLSRFIITIIATLITSHFVYQYFEKHYMKLGRIPWKNKPNPSQDNQIKPK